MLTHTPVPLMNLDTDTSPSMPFVQQLFGEPRFHTDAEICAAVFAADHSVWSIDDSGILIHWSADGHMIRRTFLSDLETLWQFSPNADRLASGNDELLLWDTQEAQLLKRIPQDSWVTAIAYSPDGLTVATGHDDGKIRFWDTAQYIQKGEIDAHSQPISALSYSESQNALASAGEDRVIRVWNADTHQELMEWVGHTDRIPALTWNPLGSLLVSGGWDTSARVWKMPQADSVMLLNSHAEQVLLTCFSPDGKLLATADSDNDLYLWSNPETGKVRHVLRGHLDEIRTIAFSADGSRLLSAGADRVIHIWDVLQGKLIAGPSIQVKHAVGYLNGPTPLLISACGPEVRVWATQTGDTIPTTNFPPAYSVAADQSGRWLALGGMDHFTRLYDRTDLNKPPKMLEATKPPIGAMAITSDGSMLAHTSPADGLVWLWNTTTAEPQLILIEAADGCTLETLAFHPNGNFLAVGGIDYFSTADRQGAVCVWDLTTQKTSFVVDVGVLALSFDPQGRYLAGASISDQVFLWDLASGEEVFCLDGHQGKVTNVCFSPDGSYVLSGSEDHTIRVWDVLTGRLMVIREFDSPIQSISFDPDGTMIYTGNENGTCFQIEFKKLLEA